MISSTIRVRQVYNSQKKDLETKAQSLGLSVSHYARNFILNRSKRDENPNTEVLAAIKSLVPTLAEALGRLQKFPPEAWEVFAQTLLRRWEKERMKS